MHRGDRGALESLKLHHKVLLRNLKSVRKHPLKRHLRLLEKCSDDRHVQMNSAHKNQYQLK